MSPNDSGISVFKQCFSSSDIYKQNQDTVLPKQLYITALYKCSLSFFHPCLKILYTFLLIWYLDHKLQNLILLAQSQNLLELIVLRNSCNCMPLQSNLKLHFKTFSALVLSNFIWFLIRFFFNSLFPREMRLFPFWSVISWRKITWRNLITKQKNSAQAGVN